VTSLGEGVRELVRPPFANYDVVVYFGCGLFALPLIYHYLVEPSQLRFPRFHFDLGMPFANEAISTLSLLFAVYLLGHIIAYLVISGLFRSLSLLFLACIWAEAYYAAMCLMSGDYPLRPLLSDANTIPAHLFNIALLYTAFGFSISSYMKFQRRYAEEAIFAFVLSPAGKPAA